MKKHCSEGPGCCLLKRDKYFHFLSKTIKFYSVLIALILSVQFGGAFFAFAETQEAGHVPWSGYWWPYQYGGLATGLDYRGKPAPLDKYTLLTEGVDNAELSDWYTERFYDPAAPDWYGLCFYWAQAACFEQYEILPSSENNIIFRVGDKKGLLTLAHNKNLYETADGSHPDIFHYWLLLYIKDNQVAFVADLDNSEEVWSFPIFGYTMQSSRTGNRESVEVTVKYASDFVHPDFMGTSVLTERYNYDLFLDQNGTIIGGEWTGDSIDNHPQKLSFPLTVQNECPYLDYARVVDLAQSADDFLEQEGMVDITPGTYNLILLNEDEYRIDCETGDMISIIIEKQPGSFQDFSVVMEDGEGSQVFAAQIEKNEPFNHLFEATLAPYTVRLQQDDYNDPNIYTLKLDLKKEFQQNIPYIPKNGFWSGFALTNPGSEPLENVMLVSYSPSGRPLQTVLGPMMLSGGEKHLFFFDDLSWRDHEYSDIASMVLMADSKVYLVNLIGGSAMACFAQANSRGSRLVIPDTVAPMSTEKSMFGGIYNEVFPEAGITVALYYDTGNLMQKMAFELDKQEYLEIRPGKDPFYKMPDGGWIEVEGSSDSILNGYQYTSSPGRAEALFAISVNGNLKIVPHVPTPGKWETSLTLINPNTENNQVVLHPKLAGERTAEDIILDLEPWQKQSVIIGDYFGKSPGDPLYHSILEVNAVHPVAGYFTYETINDEASYPLMDENDFQQELVLPHNPAEPGYWRTGICIFNPGDQAVTVISKPFDHSGNLMQEDVRALVLDPGACEVFTVSSLFGKQTNYDISFIKFRAREVQGVIGGFYLYSTLDYTMVSGAKM